MLTTLYGHSQFKQRPVPGLSEKVFNPTGTVNHMEPYEDTVQFSGLSDLFRRKPAEEKKVEPPKTIKKRDAWGRVEDVVPEKELKKYERRRPRKKF